MVGVVVFDVVFVCYEVVAVVEVVVNVVAGVRVVDVCIAVVGDAWLILRLLVILLWMSMLVLLPCDVGVVGDMWGCCC